MRCHKKTKESGFFEGEFEADINMGKALKRTNVLTTSSEHHHKFRTSDRIEYTNEELDTHIRPPNNSQGIFNINFSLFNLLTKLTNIFCFVNIHFI